MIDSFKKYDCFVEYDKKENRIVKEVIALDDFIDAIDSYRFMCFINNKLYPFNKKNTRCSYLREINYYINDINNFFIKTDYNTGFCKLSALMNVILTFQKNRYNCITLKGVVIDNFNSLTMNLQYQKNIIIILNTEDRYLEITLLNENEKTLNSLELLHCFTTNNVNELHINDYANYIIPKYQIVEPQQLSISNCTEFKNYTKAWFKESYGVHLFNTITSGITIYDFYDKEGRLSCGNGVFFKQNEFDIVTKNEFIVNLKNI